MIRMLIIDDHEMVREGLKAILLSEPDFAIVGDAANAEQALELIERLRPDIVLLDVRLPGVSGIEVCRIVTERYPETWVIILTTFTDENLIAQCIQAGARGFIVKDIERFDLKRAIRAVARGEGAIDTKAAMAVLAQLRRAPQTSQEPLPELLSSQQIVILRLVAQGLSDTQVAEQLVISRRTVNWHLTAIYSKLGVSSRVAATRYVIEQRVL